MFLLVLYSKSNVSLFVEDNKMFVEYVADKSNQ